ncbi:MAG: cation-translocating P-type ATPase, partial [Bacteroidota bacterium]
MNNACMLSVEILVKYTVLMDYYRHTTDRIFKELDSQQQGISKEEAKKRLEKHGRNRFEKQKEKSLLVLLLEQLMNPVIYLLAAATIVSFIFGDIPEGIAITVVIILNTGIGFWMEYQARQSLKALKQKDKLIVRVKRNGEEEKIDAEEIVPGDVLVLEAGDLIAAVARVFEELELSADESPLTGESVPVSKNTEKIEEEKQVGDRKNMVFKGTTITNGKGLAVVTATGMDTQIGEISGMLSETGKNKIPLNRKLTKLTHVLIWVILGLAAVYLGIGWAVGEELYLLIQTAIAWSIAAIPEGLPVVASIALARGMLRLSKQNVIVKQLASVETLGETTIIFTDKTGTLTENNLSVSAILTTTSNRYDVDEENQDMDNDPVIAPFEKVLVLNNNATMGEENEGDPLEIALLEYVKKRSEEKLEKLRSAERKHEYPFDSESKRMGTIHLMDDKLVVTAKGAADAILEKSAKIMDGDEPRDITDDDRKSWNDKNTELSAEGLRVLAVGYKEESPDNKDILEEKDFIHDLIFLGLIGFIDPPRKEVTPAIEECHQAGIKVAMV